MVDQHPHQIQLQLGFDGAVVKNNGMEKENIRPSSLLKGNFEYKIDRKTSTDRKITGTTAAVTSKTTTVNNDNKPPKPRLNQQPKPPIKKQPKTTLQNDHNPKTNPILQFIAKFNSQPNQPPPLPTKNHQPNLPKPPTTTNLTSPQPHNHQPTSINKPQVPT